jgi:hypothetical protein
MRSSLTFANVFAYSSGLVETRKLVSETVIAGAGVKGGWIKVGASSVLVTIVWISRLTFILILAPAEARGQKETSLAGAGSCITLEVGCRVAV